MYVMFFNFIDTIVKADDELLKWYKEFNCLLTSYTLARVYVPSNLIIEPIVKGFKEKILKLQPWEDAYYMEELSYRARIFIVTNLDKMLIKQYLVKYNLDVFVQDVISYNDLRRYKPSKEFFEQASKIANNVLQAIMLISSNPSDILVGKSLGMKTYWLNRRGEKYPFPSNLQPDNIVSSIKRIAEMTGEHKVDSSMGDSALRCS